MAFARSSRQAGTFSVGVAIAVAATSLLLANPAAAQVYVQVAPPPPPPPPRVYYYAPPPPPPRAYYYNPGPPPEPSNRLDLGVDLEGAIPVNAPNIDGNDLKGGGGFKVRVGDQIRLTRGIHLTLEGLYGYDHLFANDDAGNTAYSWDMNRIMGGGRLAFGRWVVPVFYAHIGYGWRGTGGDPSIPNSSGAAFDVGGALDIRVIPHFNFGAHIEYATMTAASYGPEWLALGLHFDVVF
jgi:hypothetical protein